MNRRAFFRRAVGVTAVMAGSALVARRSLDPEGAAPSALPEAVLPCGEPLAPERTWLDHKMEGYDRGYEDGLRAAAQPRRPLDRDEWALLDATRELRAVDNLLRNTVLSQHDAGLTRYVYNVETGEIGKLNAQPTELQRVIDDLTAHRNRLVHEIVNAVRTPHRFDQYGGEIRG